MTKIRHGGDYQQKRAKAYPPLTDQIDAIWKMLGTQRASLPPDTQAMLDRVLDVKATFPKGAKP